MNDSTDAKAQASLTRLLDIMRRLRDPASGCPWDREQNFVGLFDGVRGDAREVLLASPGAAARRIA